MLRRRGKRAAGTRSTPELLDGPKDDGLELETDYGFTTDRMNPDSTGAMPT